MSTRNVMIMGYIVIFAAFLAYELVTLVHPKLPGLGDGIDAVMRFRGWRWALLIGWLWLGWHFFVRSTLH
jgi:hypothetical protein